MPTFDAQVRHTHTWVFEEYNGSRTKGLSNKEETKKQKEQKHKINQRGTTPVSQELKNMAAGDGLHSPPQLESMA